MSVSLGNSGVVLVKGTQLKTKPETVHHQVGGGFKSTAVREEFPTHLALSGCLSTAFLFCRRKLQCLIWLLLLVTTLTMPLLLLLLLLHSRVLSRFPVGKSRRLLWCCAAACRSRTLNPKP